MARVLFIRLIVILASIFNSEGKKNVLFIMSDDLRPELGCYDGPDAPSPVHPRMYTPNIDKLAAKSLVLKRAYAQFPSCSPSRTSLLTARRPATTQIYSIGAYFREGSANLTTLPEYFKQNGYITSGLGKIFHAGKSSGGDDPPSWTEPYFHAPNYNLYQYTKTPGEGVLSWTAIPTTIREKNPLPDEQIATEAINQLEKYAAQDKPFFLAVGFQKPHLPFVFPAEFLKHYPPEVIELPPNMYAPVGMPAIAWHNFIKFGIMSKSVAIKHSNYTGEINTTMDDLTVLSLRRAYYSCVSYIDSLVGRLLDKVKELGLANDTVVSFMGDHGFAIGENGEWKKLTNFEISTRIPMMVHVPGKTDGGIVTHKLVEALDMFPTLVDAAGLPSLALCPSGSTSISTHLCSEGNSLMPLMSNQTIAWKSAAFSQIPSNSDGLPVTSQPENIDAMGYSVRTNKFG